MKKYRIEETMDANLETRYYILERWLGFFWRRKIKYTLGGRVHCSYCDLSNAKEAVEWFENIDRRNNTKRIRIIE
ncbi:hypothetical protein KIT04_035 [Vibrio phage KIT04]|nr:hypothetical protein KIT04_035 [Vibrio phage KIT04]